MGIPHAWWSRCESTIKDIKGECFVNFTLCNMNYDRKYIFMKKVSDNFSDPSYPEFFSELYICFRPVKLFASYSFRSKQKARWLVRMRKAFSRNSHTSFTVSLSIFTSVDRCLFSEAFVLFFKEKSAKCLSLSLTYRSLFFSELRH